MVQGAPEVEHPKDGSFPRHCVCKIPHHRILRPRHALSAVSRALARTSCSHLQQRLEWTAQLRCRQIYSCQRTLLPRFMAFQHISKPSACRPRLLFSVLQQGLTFGEGLRFSPLHTGPGSLPFSEQHCHERCPPLPWEGLCGCLQAL